MGRQCPHNLRIWWACSNAFAQALGVTKPSCWRIFVPFSESCTLLTRESRPNVPPLSSPFRDMMDGKEGGKRRYG